VRGFCEISVTKNFVTILSSNVRGLINNWHLIRAINLVEYDILAFNEVWSIKEYENLQIEGFEIKSVETRKLGRGGGVIIFGKKELKTEVINVPFIEGVFESVAIRLGNVIVINIYRPPSGSRETFIQQLEVLLASYGHNELIITGDFNINFLDQNNEIFNVCRQFGVNIKINGITRPASGTCLDNFLTNANGIYNITNISIADHLAIKARMDISHKLKKKKVIYEYRAMGEVNWLMFKHKMHNLEITGNNLNDRWNNLSGEIKQIITESFPMKTSKRNYKFSMSRALMKSRDKKNKLLRDYKAGRINKEVYINYNRTYRKLIQIEQEKSFSYKLKDAGNCGKKNGKS
jgi:hypothetical protein